MKIRNINLAISKSLTLKRESEVIEKFINNKKYGKSLPDKKNQI